MLKCLNIYESKMSDYGSAWRILRLSSLTDQVFIKAQRIRSLQIKKISKVDEGQESEAFWASIGGKGEYSHVKDCNMLPPGDFEPRLFAVSNTSGYMWMKEVP